MMKKTRNILIAEMCVSIIVSLAAVLLYETDTLVAGALPTGGNVEFIATALMEMLTICLIPFALRLFKFEKVSQTLAMGKEKALLRFGTMRMMMICLPMVVNTFLYYQFMNVAFGYMAIIGLICLAFINPSMNRCKNEVSIEE